MSNNMRSAIYIPTKCREALASLCARAVADQGLRMPVYVVTEKQHAADLDQALRSESEAGGKLGCSILVLNATDAGIGYARQEILEHAVKSNYRSIAMIDDDQKIQGNAREWLRLALRPDVGGIGVWKSYYGLPWTGTAVVQNLKDQRDGLDTPGLYGCTGAHGPQSFAFNVKNLRKSGGFHRDMRWYEDNEMIRDTIAGGRPWWVYTGVVATDFMTQNFARDNKMGGNASPGASDGPEANHLKCHKNWPLYISKPPGTYRVQWKRFWHDYLPDFPAWPPMELRSDTPWDWRKYRART